MRTQTERRPSPTQIRQRAARAFRARSRNQFLAQLVRQPDPDETPLSAAEIRYAVSKGLLAP